MFDIGLGEIILLALVGLLVFGPERLPRAAADAGRWARQIRQMAASAKSDLADSAGINLDDTGLKDTVNAVKDLRDLHPKRWATGLLNESGTGGSDSSAKNSSTGSTPAKFDPDLG